MVPSDRDLDDRLPGNHEDAVAGDGGDVGPAGELAEGGEHHPVPSEPEAGKPLALPRPARKADRRMYVAGDSICGRAARGVVDEEEGPLPHRCIHAADAQILRWISRLPVMVPANQQQVQVGVALPPGGEGPKGARRPPRPRVTKSIAQRHSSSRSEA